MSLVIGFRIKCNNVFFLLLINISWHISRKE